MLELSPGRMNVPTNSTFSVGDAGLNQRPPPSKVKLLSLSTFTAVQNYLQNGRFLLSVLRTRLSRFVWVGVLLVYISLAGNASPFASLCGF